MRRGSASAEVVIEVRRDGEASLDVVIKHVERRGERSAIVVQVMVAIEESRIREGTWW